MFVGECHTVRAHMLKKLKGVKEAREELKEAIRLGELKSGDNKQLKSFYEGILITYKEEKDSTSFYYYLEKLKSRFNQFPNAFHNPKSLEAYYLYNTGEYKRSIQKYTTLKETYKDRMKVNEGFYGEAYYTLEKSYRMEGEFDLAMENINRLIELKFGIEHTSTDITSKNLKSFNQLDVNTRLILLVFYSKKPNIFFSRFEKDSTQITQLYKAVEWYVAIDEIFFQHMEVVGEDLLLTFANEHFHSTYSRAIRACYEAYKLSEDEKYLEIGHRLLERVKYTLLYRDMLEGKSTLDATAPIDSLAKEQKINEALSRLREQKNQHYSKIIIQTELKSLALLKEQRTFYKSLKREHPDYFYSRMRQDIVSLSDFQLLLAKRQEAAIQYHLGEEMLSIFVMLPNTSHILQTPKPPELERLLKFFQYLSYDPELAYTPKTFQRYVKTANRLYQIFVEPIEVLVEGYPKLVICPDASMALFPFNSLLTKVVTDTIVDYRSLPYLLRKHELTYVVFDEKLLVPAKRPEGEQCIP